MPIFDYRSVDESAGCDYCCAGFEHLERLNAEPLTACPKCGAAVHKLLSAPSFAIGGAHLLNEKRVGNAGFTQYRKNGKGTYEKTAGKGPDSISADQRECWLSVYRLKATNALQSDDQTLTFDIGPMQAQLGSLPYLNRLTGPYALPERHRPGIQPSTLLVDPPSLLSA